MATINKTLFPLKVVLFCWYGATACLLPYMTIHMKDLGITVAETSIIYTILPFTQMIGSPLAGVAADKMGRYKPVLILTLGMTAAFGTAILFVPSINPPTMHLARHSLSCSGDNPLTYTIAKCNSEQTCPDACQSTCFTLLDATTLAMVDNHEGLYGRQRFWAILATAIFSPVTGFLIDHISERNGYPDYSPAFYFFNALVIITGIMVYMLDVQVVPPAEQIIKNVTKLLRLPNVIMLLIVIFWLGTVWGFIESFLFWYLLDLGSPNYLLGLTLTTGAIVGLPFLYESEWFVKKAGQVNLLILALFVYFLRCFGYSYIRSPWWCIPFEGLEAFTYHLMWVAAATYSANLAPQNLLATIQGCVGGLHFGVGRGAGSFIGGMIMSDYGAHIAFRVMGISSGILAVMYALAHYTYLRDLKNLTDDVKSKDYQEKSDPGESLDPMIIKLSPLDNHKEEKANGGLLAASTNSIDAVALDERTCPV
ncbi:hypothetical protein LAZ67_1000499 [Cordylochernes scorpioides]|uniref:Major facilitator superfamily associated domain-containing protein n=1 Tax=Cordylochernes scorpioides TaxID=51811 RepID=A0ABY6JUS0_9ARAC|nr:hypothetical protein LAZ67_1000499 [Cordylochernes scorpioides]